MGYCYEMAPNGRQRLVCDACGNAPGGVRKVPCRYGYCQAAALCAACRKDPAVKARRGAYCDEHCKDAAAAFAAREAREKALLAAGEYVRTSAVNRDGGVLVTFRNANGEKLVVQMAADAYDAVPLLDPATPADYERSVA